MIGVGFQATAYGFEGLIKESWQFYIGKYSNEVLGLAQLILAMSVLMYDKNGDGDGDAIDIM